MPVWGIYSVLLKRRPPELGGLPFLFVISLAGVLMLSPVPVALVRCRRRARWPAPAGSAGRALHGD